MSPTLPRRQRVVVTRARHQAGELTAALERVGAEVAHLPLFEIAGAEDPEPLARAVTEIGRYSWIVFASSNAVGAFCDRLQLADADRRFQTAAIGPATARALRDRGLEPDAVAKRSVAEGLLEELLPRLQPGSRVLVPQAADARPALVEGLRRAGIETTAIVAYRKVTAAGLRQAAARLFGHREIGWATFTSPRIARRFAALFDEEWSRRCHEVRALSIGPTTSTELARLGVQKVAEARSPTALQMALAFSNGSGVGIRS